MGLNKSKRKPGFTIGVKENKKRDIHYLSFVDGINSNNVTILFIDENGEHKKVDIPINELLMNKCLNIRQLSFLIDKKTK